MSSKQEIQEAKETLLQSMEKLVQALREQYTILSSARTENQLDTLTEETLKLFEQLKSQFNPYEAYLISITLCLYMLYTIEGVNLPTFAEAEAQFEQEKRRQQSETN